MRTLVLACSMLVAAAFVGAPVAHAARPRRGPCTAGPHSPTCHYWYGTVTKIVDGDTLHVDIAGDHRGPRRVRLTGINAMELTRYSDRPSRRRGECHAVEAAARLERLVRESHWRVRLAALRPSSRSGHRLRRQVSVRVRGRWVDTGRTLIAEGHALWLPSRREWAWNSSYRTSSMGAAARGKELWKTDYCGSGPDQGVRLKVRIRWRGRNGYGSRPEAAVIYNRSFTTVPLRGWWLRDSFHRRYRFPLRAVVGGRSTLTVRVKHAPDEAMVLSWWIEEPIFDNPTFGRRSMGDGGYLFDPDGDMRAWDIYPTPDTPHNAGQDICPPEDPGC